MSAAITTSKKNVGVKVDSVFKSFGLQEVLKGISFEVQPGEMFVIMGPSGSGKSVLLRLLIGLESPDVGDIQIDQESIKDEAVLNKHNFAMVFQSGALLNSLTVEENVGLYLTEHRLMPQQEIKDRVHDSLKMVGLEGKEPLFPNQLSGGMKKRVAIARAMIMEPSLMLYDEPTSELDPVSSVTIADQMRDLHERTNSTSIVVTHDRELAFGMADRIAILIDGKLLAIGTPDEVRKTPNEEVSQFLSVSYNPTQRKSADPH
ncbi:ATP-binding cassette domain-containing protein [Verrucomicrobia bacterium]|nr:ATP-binding cassette domain-containing protein [Verrucomicrobiota bacterium]